LLYYFCSIKLRLALRYNILLNQNIHQVAACHILHYQKQIVLILKRVNQIDYPLSTVSQNISLSLQVYLLILFNHLLLLQAFYSYYPIVFLLSTKPDLSKGASTYYSNWLKIFLRNLVSLLSQFFHLGMDYPIFGLLLLLNR